MYITQEKITHEKLIKCNYQLFKARAPTSLALGIPRAAIRVEVVLRITTVIGITPTTDFLG